MAKQIGIMYQAVNTVLGTMDIGSPGFWRRVEEEMPKLNATHRFSAQAIAGFPSASSCSATAVG